MICIRSLILLFLLVSGALVASTQAPYLWDDIGWDGGRDEGLDCDLECCLEGFMMLCGAVEAKPELEENFDGKSKI